VIESDLWAYINGGMDWEADRIEDQLASGVPDVSYTLTAVRHCLNCGATGFESRCGWLELKVIPRWPVRGGVVKVGHFTSEQREWLERRFPSTYLLLLVDDPAGREYVLLDGRTAARALGRVKREALLLGSLGHWAGKINFIELGELL